MTNELDALGVNKLMFEVLADSDVFFQMDLMQAVRKPVAGFRRKIEAAVKRWRDERGVERNSPKTIGQLQRLSVPKFDPVDLLGPLGDSDRTEDMPAPDNSSPSAHNSGQRILNGRAAAPAVHNSESEQQDADRTPHQTTQHQSQATPSLGVGTSAQEVANVALAAQASGQTSQTSGKTPGDSDFVRQNGNTSTQGPTSPSEGANLVIETTKPTTTQDAEPRMQNPHDTGTDQGQANPVVEETTSDPWEIGPIDIPSDDLREAQPGVYVSKRDALLVPPDALLAFREEIEGRLQEDLKSIKDKVQAKIKHPRTRDTVYEKPELRMSGEATDGRVILSPTIWIPCPDALVQKVEKKINDGAFKWAHNSGFGKMMVGSAAKLLAAPALGCLPGTGLELRHGLTLYLHIENPGNRQNDAIICRATLARGHETVAQHCSRIGGLISINERQFGLTTAHGLLGDFWDEIFTEETREHSLQDGRLSSTSDPDGSRSADREGEGSTDGNIGHGSSTTSATLGAVSLDISDWVPVQLGDFASFVGHNIIPARRHDLTHRTRFLKDLSKTDFAFIDLGDWQAELPKGQNVELGIKATTRVGLGDRDGDISFDLEPGPVDVSLGPGLTVRGSLLKDAGGMEVLGAPLNTNIIRLPSPLAWGSSGAWVFRGDFVCGMIVAGYDDEPYAHMTSMASLEFELRDSLQVPEGAEIKLHKWGPADTIEHPTQGPPTPSSPYVRIKQIMHALRGEAEETYVDTEGNEEAPSSVSPSQNRSQSRPSPPTPPLYVRIEQPEHICVVHGFREEAEETYADTEGNEEAPSSVSPSQNRSQSRPSPLQDPGVGTFRPGEKAKHSWANLKRLGAGVAKHVRVTFNVLATFDVLNMLTKPREDQTSSRRDRTQLDRDNGGIVILALLDLPSFNWVLFMIVGLGFFSASYNLYATNMTAPVIQYIYWEHQRASLLVFLANMLGLAGTFFGMIASGISGSYYGTRRYCRHHHLLMVLGTLGMAISGVDQGKSEAVLGLMGLWRFLVGFAVGYEYPLAAVTCAEFASTRTRSRIVVAVVLMQSVGLVVAHGVGVGASRRFLGRVSVDAPADSANVVWRLVVGLGAVPAALAFLVQGYLPESPRFLMDVCQDQANADQAAWAIVSQSAYIEQYIERGRLRQRSRQEQRRDAELTIGTQLELDRDFSVSGDDFFVSDNGFSAFDRQVSQQGHSPRRFSIDISASRHAPASPFTLSRWRQNRIWSSRRPDGDRESFIWWFHSIRRKMPDYVAWKTVLAVAVAWFCLGVTFRGLGFDNPQVLSTYWLSETWPPENNMTWPLESDLPDFTTWQQSGASYEWPALVFDGVGNFHPDGVFYDHWLAVLKVSAAPMVLGPVASLFLQDYVPRSSLLRLTSLFSLLGLCAMGGTLIESLGPDAVPESLIITFYAITQFFITLGPNTLLFSLPAELVPTRFRSIVHGLVLAPSILGAVAVQIVSYVLRTTEQVRVALVFVFAALCLMIPVARIFFVLGTEKRNTQDRDRKGWFKMEKVQHLSLEELAKDTARLAGRRRPASTSSSLDIEMRDMV